MDNGSVESAIRNGGCGGSPANATAAEKSFDEGVCFYVLTFDVVTAVAGQSDAAAAAAAAAAEDGEEPGFS